MFKLQKEQERDCQQSPAMHTASIVFHNYFKLKNTLKQTLLTFSCFCNYFISIPLIVVDVIDNCFFLSIYHLLRHFY